MWSDVAPSGAREYRCESAQVQVQVAGPGGSGRVELLSQWHDPDAVAASGASGRSPVRLASWNSAVAEVPTRCALAPADWAAEEAAGFPASETKSLQRVEVPHPQGDRNYPERLTSGNPSRSCSSFAVYSIPNLVIYN